MQHKVDEMGARLSAFPHKRLGGRPECKLRVADYRVLYEFDAAQGAFTFTTLEIAEISISDREYLFRARSCEVTLRELNHEAEESGFIV